MRKLRGMSQPELADAMNVSQLYVSQIENGRKQLASLLTDYAFEFGAHIEYVSQNQLKNKSKTSVAIIQESMVDIK